MVDSLPAQPRSYWHATAAPPIPNAPLPTTADVVVVGGGLLGCWTAYWLAKGGTQVTVLEQQAISWGATGRNGGFVRGGTTEGFTGAAARIGREAALAVWKLSMAGQALVPQIVAEEGIDCDLRTPGTLSLALGEESYNRMQHYHQTMQAEGLAGKLLNHADAQELVITPLADEVAGAVYYPDGMLLHSGRYLAGLAAAAQRHGAQFVRAKVTGLQSNGTSTTLTTDAGTVQAGRVVIALNAWSDELIPELSEKVVPVRGQILAYEPTERAFDPGIGASVTPTGEYWQQTPDGSIVIGGCREDAPNADVGVREMVPTPDVIAKIAAVIPRLFPQLNNLTVARSWAGLMAFTSDYLPVADAAPNLPGVWVTGGYCGGGMPFGPRIGQLLAEAVTTGTTPALLQPLRIDRPTLVRYAERV